ncbi:hypothetical protein WAI453_000899 [Rhynchosporium graminicola]
MSLRRTPRLHLVTKRASSDSPSIPIALGMLVIPAQPRPAELGKWEDCSAVAFAKDESDFLFIVLTLYSIHF